MLRISKILRTSLLNTSNQLMWPKAGVISSRFFSYKFDDKMAKSYLDTVICLLIIIFSQIENLNTAGFKTFSDFENPNDRNMIQYVDLTPTLIKVLNNKSYYAHSLFAPRRFGKSVFLQMMSDFGMRTLMSSKEYYKDDLGHL